MDRSCRQRIVKFINNLLQPIAEKMSGIKLTACIYVNEKYVDSSFVVMEPPFVG